MALQCRITIFTGNLGSGKTELAASYALHLRQDWGLPTAIVDLDIVNPYFRTRLIEKPLTAAGVRVICPRGRLAAADIPSLSAEVKAVFTDKNLHGVFDVGGDDVGATALGQYRDELPAGEYRLLFVINACRPFTRRPVDIERIMGEISQAARLPVDGLVSNTNLGAATDLDTFLAGHAVVEEVARQTGLPIVLAGVLPHLLTRAQAALPQIKFIPVRRFMVPPWADNS
ncbi:hypothetical protein [Desulfurispora thermophila]|uniref:hypothetical protein n=1 Tax=Desulfurispora thermophila TaxID=265470 RepID=UPI00036CADA1|nr:hypothetical protein [Desulfurispora thermophila]